MTLGDDLRSEVRKTFRSGWTTKESDTVPEPADVKLGNDAITLESATVLYADLSESTALVRGYKDWFAAEIYKTYLYCAARIIRSMGGTITAYDGDRVMAVFVGGLKNTNAATTALKINYAVLKIIQPEMQDRYPNDNYTLRQTVGIDTSKLFVARTGVRGDNDLVWVGRAANYAAKMAALRPRYSTYISADVYNMLKESAKLGNGQNMWTDLGSGDVGINIYGSTWHWSI